MGHSIPRLNSYCSPQQILYIDSVNRYMAGLLCVNNWLAINWMVGAGAAQV